MIRLAHGVTAGRGHGVWAPGHDGMPLPALEAALEPGAAVAVGPDAAAPEAVERAVRELAAVVAAGGVAAAGAGIDLSAGFRSARLAGARGDRRDAILAALPVLGVDGAPRLGEREGVLVALFGPRATKPVGAAAGRAMQEGRWPALHLASAASDLLGPEQLERVLDLPAGAADVLGPASALATHLDQVLGGLPRTRRLTVLLDLWDVVCAERERNRRRQLLRAVGQRTSQFERVWRRYQTFTDDYIVNSAHGRGTMAEGVRWNPPIWVWRQWLDRGLHDALAATVLVRTLIAMTEDGAVEGLLSCHDQIATASFLISDEGVAQARSRVSGMIGVPARPGVYLRELATVSPNGVSDRRIKSFVDQRLARAHDYARAVWRYLDALLSDACDTERPEIAQGWDCGHLRQWRRVAGFSPVREPGQWRQPPLLAVWPDLAQRLESDGQADPAAVEMPADLVWYAELADVVAQLAGLDSAQMYYGDYLPRFGLERRPHDDEPLRPPADSVPLALARAAQLVAIGAEVPTRPRTWADLVDGLLGSAAVAEALTGSFPLPAAVAAFDGRALPGTEAVLELARGPHQLADWSGFMGNCIADSWYLNEASRGKCVLAALRQPDGRIIANVELLPRRPASRGWRVGELKARFNEEPDPELAKRITEWVASLPGPTPVRRVAPTKAHAHTARRSRRGGLTREVGELLATLAAEALNSPEAVSARTTLAAAPDLATATAVRRTPAARLDEAVRAGLAGGALDLDGLWRATRVRPLAAAVAQLDPAVRERHGQLEFLLADAPLPPSVRRVARQPAVAEARTVDLVARRLRAALGRLARADDPVVAAAVVRDADTAMLCALVLAVSTAPGRPAALTRITEPRGVAVPGFPASTLDDEAGPWRSAWPDAVELGADGFVTGAEADGTGVAGLVAPIGLAMPTSWLGRGGWPALWARAARRSRTAR